ncbi:hypothetical protein L207DRAFT_572260 [Hyaloscypha variabilis F]|uniref:Uncharacterized protein n=1 Tax=Hyaloscypha variabilis (strain UAMH 11265 / GT02V1 / F) TaxID=1149755 RepID=A0A2J6R092_HYAVF|nr:hypothetical protein L207DRAFT_572260 [Hyaloscypha variabilis F]
MSGTETLWDKLKDTADTFSTSIVLKGLPALNETSGGHDDITMEIRGTLTCAAASRKDNQEDKKYDYFLLTQSLGFTPPSGKEIAMYVVILRALADASTAFTAFPNESTPIANYWTGQDDFSGYRWARSWQPATLAKSVFLTSDPKGADNTSSYSTQSSISIGANAGFFGDIPTIGIEASWTMSHAQSVTLTPVKIVDGSTNDTLQIAFIPQQQKSSDFQPLLQGILQIDDDGTGKRSKTDSDARKIALELRVIILPKDQVRRTHHFVRTDRKYGTGEGEVYYNDVYDDHDDQAYHEFSRVIHLPLPPVPKA